MSKILVVPDVHGRDFWKEPCLNWDGEIIFLGDYHDPYPYQCSKEKSIENLKEIVDFAEKNRNRCYFLIGNHDTSYLGIKCPLGGRTDWYHRKEVSDLLRKFETTYVIIKDDCLFSHSGILPEWLKAWRLDYHLNLMSPNHLAWEDVSPYRGGISHSGVGSVLFGDVREYAEHEHLPGFYQIFGHTQLEKDPIIEKDFACLDCRQCFIVDTKTHEIIPYGNCNNE